MTTRPKKPIWDYLVLMAENTRLAAENERLKMERRDLEQNHQTITRLAEQQALELLQLRQGMQARVKWKCQMHTGIQKEQYERLLNEGWTISHRQFEAGQLNVVAEKQEPIEPPVRETLAEKKARLNAVIAGRMMDTYDAAGGNQSFESIEEIAHGRGNGTRTGTGYAGRGTAEAADGDYIITVTQH